jgi:hypothetical protein
MIDQYPSHRLRRDPEKVRPVLPVHFALIDQFQIRLIDKSRRLKRVTDPFAPQEARRLPVQLGMNDGHKLIESVFLPQAPLVEPQRYLRPVIGRSLHDVRVCDEIDLTFLVSEQLFH